MGAAAHSAELALADQVAEFYADPLRFVLFAYPWGEAGPLAQYEGPDAWQRAYLEDLGRAVRARPFDGRTAVAPVRMAASSGHGTGKSTLVAWLVDWIMSTRPGCRGTVTANTFPQLQSKTWAAIRTWTKRLINAHWFDVSGTRLWARADPAGWFVQAATAAADRSEAFAGQHAATSTSFYVFDEASAIAEEIWEVAEGGLTDGAPMIFAFGNPTRSQGKFFRVCFGSERDYWDQRTVDSRTSAFTNKQQIAEWLEIYGEDSDFFRVRVRGLPPAASDLQFISAELVWAAQRRQVVVLDDEPLVAGLDVARGGADNCVLRFRRGLDARSIPPVRVPGEQARDSMTLVSLAADVLARSYDGRRVAVLFVDETGLGGPIVDRLRQLGHRNVVGVQFGEKPPDYRQYKNMRAWMYGRMRIWLERGAIDDDQRLELDLTGPGYGHDREDRLVLESKEDMKKRGLDSPDDADALALTFAQAVGPERRLPGDRHEELAGPAGWMG